MAIVGVRVMGFLHDWVRFESFPPASLHSDYRSLGFTVEQIEQAFSDKAYRAIVDLSLRALRVRGELQVTIVGSVAYYLPIGMPAESAPGPRCTAYLDKGVPMANGNRLALSARDTAIFRFAIQVAGEQLEFRTVNNLLMSENHAKLPTKRALGDVRTRIRSKIKDAGVPPELVDLTGFRGRESSKAVGG